MIKAIALILFALIVFNLFRGLYYLVNDKGDSKRMVNSLGWRVGLSIGLIVFLLIAAALGWITPHGVAL